MSTVRASLLQTCMVIATILSIVLVPIFAEPTKWVLDEEKKVTRIKVNETASIQMFDKWQEQAISGLMAALATKALVDLPKGIVRKHEKCAKKSDSIQMHAACVTELLEYKKRFGNTVVPPEKKDPTLTTTAAPQRLARFKPKSIFSVRNRHKEAQILKPNSKNQKQEWVGTFDVRNRNKNTKYVNPESKNEKWVGSFGVARDKRETDVFDTFESGVFNQKKNLIRKSDNSYALSHSSNKLSPFGQVARLITGVILNAKNKTAVTSWQDHVMHIEGALKKRKNLRAEAKRVRELDPLQEMAHRGISKKMPDLEDIFFDKDKRRQYLNEISDPESEANDRPERKFMRFLRQGLKLGMTLMGQNTTNFENRTLRVASPRFFSVMPDNANEFDDGEDPIDFLSPSILSLHNQGNPLEKTLSFSNILKGFGNADQQQILDMVFEATDIDKHMNMANQAIDFEFQKTVKKRYQDEMVNDKGEPLYFTKEKALEVLDDNGLRRIDLFEQLVKTYTKEQVKEMNETGYAMLNQDQLNLMYGKDSPYHNQTLLNILSNVTHEEYHKQMMYEIQQLALEHTRLKQQQNGRHKRYIGETIVLTNVLLSPTILNPAGASVNFVLCNLVLSPLIGSPAIFSSVILSPWLFLPLVLSPRVIAPAILDPFVFVPVILSPIIMNPFIICPGVFNPFILSPTIMCPFILAPQVFTPFILNPNIMSPFILSPSVGTPLILTPHVLTPLVFTPLALIAVVLSPQVASPVISSPFFLAEVILSPTFLS